MRNRLDLGFEDLGEQQFKNIAQPVRAFRVNCVEAGFPYADLASCESLPLPNKPSIAILPFASLSSDPAQEYLADGLRLDIQAALVKASGLFLIAPNTVARYRNAEISAEQAGRQMGVRYVLEGAVQRSDKRLRTTVELTDVVARRIVWAERYDRILDDGLAIQDEITAEVLKALDVQLASGEKWLLHSTLKSLEALDCFYRGLSRFYAGTKSDNAAAREMFERVARLQPDSAVGPAYLCFTYWVDAFRGWTDSRQRSLAEAARWAKKSVKYSTSNGLAHIVLASIHLLKRRHEQALADCYKAVDLRPNCPTANIYLANVLHYCGRPAEAISKVGEAIRITPLYPPWYMSLLAAAYRDSGQLAQSLAAARHGIRLSPSDLEPRLILCSAHILAGQKQQAREWRARSSRSIRRSRRGDTSPTSPTRTIKPCSSWRTALARRGFQPDEQASARPGRSSMAATPVPERPMPDHPTLKFAAIGLDHRHIYHQVGRLLALGAECVGFHARDSAVPLAGFVERFPHLKRVADPQELLDDPQVQLIVSAGIPGERADIAIAAMRHGKDVMVDKPGRRSPRRSSMRCAPPSRRPAGSGRSTSPSASRCRR